MNLSDTTPPVGYNDAGEPIETVTVEATRLPDWLTIALLIGLGLIAFDFLPTE